MNYEKESEKGRMKKWKKKGIAKKEQNIKPLNAVVFEWTGPKQLTFTEDISKRKQRTTYSYIFFLPFSIILVLSHFVFFFCFCFY